MCAYCEQPIEDNTYTYKWFPELKQMLPVHNEHLIFSRKDKDE